MTEKKSFAAYVAETKKEYKYVLKFAVNEMTDSMIDKLESSLTRYQIKSASSFRKTPIQESPLDFPNVKNTPVFICDLTLEYPGSLDFLRTYISNTLGIPMGQIAVYSECDPRQIETDLYIERNSREYKEKYVTRLGSDYESEEAPAYGEKYNSDFLRELDKVSKERRKVTVENPLSPAETINHDTLPSGYDDFNSEKNLNKDTVGLFGRIKRPNLKRTGA